MEYKALMKDPKYQKIYAQSYAKEFGQLVQGIDGHLYWPPITRSVNRVSGDGHLPRGGPAAQPS